MTWSTYVHVLYIYILYSVYVIYIYICTYTVYIYTVVYIYIIYTMFTVPFLYLHRSFSHRKFHVSGPSTWPISLAASAAFFSWSWWQSKDATNWVDVKYKCQYLIWNICGEYIWYIYIYMVNLYTVNLYICSRFRDPPPLPPPMVMVPPSPLWMWELGGWIYVYMSLYVYMYICKHVYMVYM